MIRISLSDGTGRWFHKEDAWEFPEGTEWNNRKRISLATGSEGQHEVLYRTKKDNWILMQWAEPSDGTEKYLMIPIHEAVAWLLRSGYTPGESGRFAMDSLEI